MEFQLKQAVEILEQTPRTLHTLLTGLSAPWILNDEGPDTWSPGDVVGHLIDGEKTDWIPRAKIILEHGETKTFTPFDRFAFSRESKNKPLPELLDTFEKLRRENLLALEALALEQLVATWVVHDLGHIAQIVRTMAKQYHDNVGPWKAYLPVLTR